MAPARNVAVDGRWYGPDYPDAGDPPKGSVGDHVYAEEGDGPVSAEPVTTPESPAAADPPRPKRPPRSSRTDG